MTILGMQTDTQHLYFPGYISYRDANLDGSCSVWPADKMPINGHYYNGNLALPFPDPILAYKDKFKHIMLQHEATFKSQVHELHRLYNKQRELMVELRSIDLHPENSASSQNNKNKGIHWLNPSREQSFVSLPEKNQCDIYCESKESVLLEAKCKRVGKKILDLELPASEYIDSDSEESLAEETNLSKIPSDPMKSSVEKERCLADLNEPVKLEETDNEESQQLQLEAQVIEERKTSDPQSSVSTCRKIVQALPCSKSSLLLRGGCKRRSNHYARDSSCNQIDFDISCYSPNDAGKSSKELDLESSAMPDSDKTDPDSTSKLDKKSSGSKFCIDLNLSINEDESSLTETELHPPESSENREQHPCEGDSDVVRMAAEAIVSIASCKVEKGDSLYWFAEVAAGVVDDPDSEFGLVLSYKNDDEIDCFEAMEHPRCEATHVQVEAALARAGGARRGRRGRATFEGRSLLDWGKITRRRRGQRSPANNPRLIVGQV